VMFFIELVVPFLIFGPRRVRVFAFWWLLLLQVLIAITGNYCFFNLLTFALCVLLLDDSALRCILRKGKPAGWDSTSHRKPGWPIWIAAPLASVIFLITACLAWYRLDLHNSPPAWVETALSRVAPFDSFNSYGLFMVMTTTRDEIIVEGSNDGATWLPYEFKYKPGDLKRRPAFVAPHQPRLDWQMWFAALGSARQNPWFINFCIRLLQGSPDVLALLEKNPFPDQPPKYIRAQLYQYHFTNFQERRDTGDWWRRELKGAYLPPISLDMIKAPSDSKNN
jgi:hypothetical protein